MMERVENIRRNPMEAELETELHRYETAREHAENALAELLEGADLSPEDERVFLTEQAALLHADVLAVIQDQEGADAIALGTRLQQLARQLYVRKHPDTAGLKKKKREMREEADAARELLAELRTRRRTRIEELRGVIDRLNDGDELNRAVDECCALMEEEIGSLRAGGDEHMASMVSASLEIVRGRGRSKEKKEEEIGPTKDEKEWAHSIVAGLLMTGDVATGNARVAENEAITFIVANRGGSPNEDPIIRHILSSLRSRDRAIVRSVLDIDPREALVTGVQARA